MGRDGLPRSRWLTFRPRKDCREITSSVPPRTPPAPPPPNPGAVDWLWVDMIGAIFILTPRGDPLLYRLYRDGIGKKASDIFRLHILNQKTIRSPIRCQNDLSIFHIRSGEVWFVAVGKGNADAALTFSLLEAVSDNIKTFIGAKALTEAKIKSNLWTIYELLDEMLDFGYPQMSDVESLSVMSLLGGKSVVKKKKDEQAEKITVKVTGACPWRSDDIRYKKNELFIDIVESVNLLMSNNNVLLSTSVNSSVLIRCKLSGMPDCRLGLNDKLLMGRENKNTKTAIGLEDCTFHQCVKLGEFDTDRTISFTPPDGSFELMKYRATENIHHPFRVQANVKEHGKFVDAKLSVKANFNPKLYGVDVMIKVPVPENTASCKIEVSKGKAKYSPKQSAILWKMRRFPGGVVEHLSAKVIRVSTVDLNRKSWVRPPVTVKFQIPMFTASHLHVRFLKVYERSGYPTTKWVRYITKAGNYHFKI